MKLGRNDPCPCGSGKKYKRCCFKKPVQVQPEAGVASSAESTTTVLFKPVQFFGVLPVRPSDVLGKKGAVVQFVVPGLAVGRKDASAFERMAQACGPEVEKSGFGRVTGDTDKQPGTLVSIAFHYVPSSSSEEPRKDPAERIGRLLAERFVSFLSFAVGERLVALHQQVSKANRDGSFAVGLHPQSKRAGEGRKIEVPDALCDLRPSEDIFKALFWLRRGLADRDHLDAYAALMVALEILALILVPAETTTKRCPSCGADLGRLTRSSVKALVTDILGGTDDQFNRLWKLRNSIVAHGGQPVIADVLHELVEMKLDAVALAFKAMRLAFGLSPDGAPQPSHIVMATDTFFGAE